VCVLVGKRSRRAPGNNPHKGRKDKENKKQPCGIKEDIRLFQML